jgi:hypothetical protein
VEGDRKTSESATMIKRMCSEVECDVCGTKFVQSRWWQMYCSRKCATTRKHYNGGEIYRLRTRIVELEARIEELQNPPVETTLSIVPGRKELPYWMPAPSQADRQTLQGEEDQSTKWGNE